MSGAVVVLSGGLDSAYNLVCAAESGEARLALSFDYGQRAASAELKAARSLADYYKVPWRSIPLTWLGEINPTALTRSEHKLPQLQLNELDHAGLTQASKRAVWVANRNGLFLNIAASFAEAFGYSRVLTGFNREEAATFPDNSLEYLAALNGSLRFSTQNRVSVDSYCKTMDKSEIMADVLRRKLPLDLVWSCYEAGPSRCWKCESCKRSERALRTQGAAGLEWLKRLGGQV